MIQFLEFTVDQATIIAFALPIVAVCLFILINLWLKKGGASKIRRYLSYLVSPPKIDSSGSTSLEGSEPVRAARWRTTKVKLFFYYFGIALFLVSFMIGEFYEVMFDLLLPVSQGSTGEFRSVTSIVFQTPYSAGWIGALPWSGLVRYHETWNWIFLTSAFTDNPSFLLSVSVILLLISVVGGFVFLAPLATKRIRHSFMSSMFFFMTSMTIFTKVAISSLGYAMALAFGNVELIYSNLVATGSMIPGLLDFIAVGIPIVLAMFAFFIVLGRRLWRTYYTDSKSRNGFMLYITLSFCVSLILTIVLV